MLLPRMSRWKPLALIAATVAVLTGITMPPAANATNTSYDSTYYKNAVGKTGTTLKSSLHTIISSQTKISYSAVWNALMVTDQDPNNSSNVILLYSGVSRSKSLNGGDVGDWNREHTWAKSHGDFGEATGPGTDLHHLRPRTSRSTAPAATWTSTTAAVRSPTAAAASSTPTPSSRATPTRATWPA